MATTFTILLVSKNDCAPRGSPYTTFSYELFLKRRPSKSLRLLKHTLHFPLAGIAGIPILHRFQASLFKRQWLGENTPVLDTWTQATIYLKALLTSKKFDAIYKLFSGAHEVRINFLLYCQLSVAYQFLRHGRKIIHTETLHFEELPTSNLLSVRTILRKYTTRQNRYSFQHSVYIVVLHDSGICIVQKICSLIFWEMMTSYLDVFMAKSILQHSVFSLV